MVSKPRQGKIKAVALSLAQAFVCTSLSMAPSRRAWRHAGANALTFLMRDGADCRNAKVRFFNRSRQRIAEAAHDRR